MAVLSETLNRQTLGTQTLDKQTLKMTNHIHDQYTIQQTINIENANYVL